MSTAVSGRAFLLVVSLALLASCRNANLEPAPGHKASTITGEPVARSLAELTTDSGANDAGPNCGQAGDPSTGLDGGASCTGNLASLTFRRAICACNSLQIAAHLATDGFDNTQGPPNGGLGDSGASNGDQTWAAHVTIGGDLLTPGNLQTGGSSEVLGNLTLGGRLALKAPFTVDGNAFVVNSLPRNVTVNGAVNHVSLVPAPCDCSNIIPVASMVAAHRRPANDNAAIGLSASAGIGTHSGQIDLPCGSYYLSGIQASDGPLTVFAHGHTALYVDGDITASSPLSFQLDSSATLDIFIA